MKPDLRTYILGDEGARLFGPGPRELLERVESLGSLRAAAISMGMAYTKAFRMIKTAEESLGCSLTQKKIGGAGGGGSTLTPEGRELLRRYRAFECACEKDMRRNFSECFSGFCQVPRVGCVVMASGEARRFGSNKLLADLAGRPVLAHTLDALPADLLDTVVVTRSPEVQALCEKLGVACVLHAGACQSDTIREGLRALVDLPGVLFVPGDQACLAEKSVRALVAEFQERPGSIVRLAWKGVGASPILWPAEELPSLAMLKGNAGGASLLASRPELAARVRLVEATGALETHDIDTVDDLRFIERELLGA